MHVYRITDQRYKKDLSGKGASLFGGRWNKIDQPVIYSSFSISLACLELLVNVDLSFTTPDYALMTIDIPNKLDVLTISPTDLPKDWRSNQRYSITREIATSWLFEEQYPVLKVPSAVIPQESNYIINVNHPAAGRIKIVQTDILKFDQRLLM